MSIRLVQVRTASERFVVAMLPSGPRRILDSSSTYGLAELALARSESLEHTVEHLGYGAAFDVAAALRCGQVLPPIDHEEPARLWLTGTGLTHLGSAEARDSMHASAQSEEATDSLKMFRLGLEGGKPPPAMSGVQPEWFYKGNGSSLVAPEAPLESPSFALDGGEEPELAGIYLIDPVGVPARLGFALANEFSDHLMERLNYLYLAHSKLRPAALGPELLSGDLPSDLRGTVRLRRQGAVHWERRFSSGESNMSHFIRNLEHHHFKYPIFRRPGDVHVHFFGTATLSFTDGIRSQDGDVFELEAAPFTLPLRNPLRLVHSPVPAVRAL